MQAEFKGVSDELTRAEVDAAHLGDRRSEAARELAEIGGRLGEEIGPAERPLTDAERERDRSAPAAAWSGAVRRSDPVNPLAEREYEEARDHVSDLQGQREDTARAHVRAAVADPPRSTRRSSAPSRRPSRRPRRTSRRWSSTSFPGAGGSCGGSPCGRSRRRSGINRGRGRCLRGGEEEDGSEREVLGVEIEVTPAGKSTRKLSLLSGGEKSLVALAFVFAVFLARPCPFYILDEVEAALDDANIDRFLQLIRRFSDRAQFVIVTHQKRTMEAADVLYGVSMGGDGVTKVVSRRLPREEDADSRCAASFRRDRGGRGDRGRLRRGPRCRPAGRRSSISAAGRRRVGTQRGGRVRRGGSRDVQAPSREPLPKPAGARRGDLGQPL